MTVLFYEENLGAVVRDAFTNGRVPPFFSGSCFPSPLPLHLCVVKCAAVVPKGVHGRVGTSVSHGQV